MQNCELKNKCNIITLMTRLRTGHYFFSLLDNYEINAYLCNELCT